MVDAANILDLELTSDAFFANPAPVYHRLRETSPVHWSETWGAWVLTRYEDVLFTLHNPDIFSSAGRVTYLLKQLSPESRQQVATLERHYNIGLAHSDPPDHTRLRALLHKVFTPRMIESRRVRIEEVVHKLIDQVEKQGHMDIIHDLAYPLPATIIAEMIGAPADDIGLFREWAAVINRLFELGGRISESAAKTAQNSLYDMKVYITRLVEERRQHPRDDILGRLVAAEEDQLSIDQLVSTAVTLFVAGHETTTNLIGNGMLALLQHPDQMQLLKDRPALMSAAVEEMLRYDPSVPRGWRLAKADVELGGQQIKQGSLIFPMLAAANRDPEYFSEPDRFDIQRDPNKHLSFGYGIHFCLGAPLARLEAAIAFDAILYRLPTIRLASEALSWRRDVAIRSLNALPVTF